MSAWSAKKKTKQKKQKKQTEHSDGKQNRNEDTITLKIGT